MITLAEIKATGLPLTDHGAIASVLSQSRTAVVEYWLTDRGLVSDLVVMTGDTAMSDSVLTKLDAMADQSRSVKALTNRLYNDARGLNFGDPAMRGWIAANPLFSDDEKAAMLALAIKPEVVTSQEVTKALEGR